MSISFIVCYPSTGGGMYIFDKNAAVGWASYHLRLLVLVLEVGHPEYISSRQQRLQ